LLLPFLELFSVRLNQIKWQAAFPGMKALSDMPRNQRMAIRPPKFSTATTMVVVKPKQNIMTGRTRLEPYFLPANPQGKGAVST
jgi:hypothetical protein